MERVNVLGVGVSAINMNLALASIEEWVEKQSQNYVCVTGVHGVMESQTAPELRKIHNCAGLVTPDGMPLVWVGRASGHHDMNRVYGPDLLLAVCQQSLQKQYRHYFYGGAEGIPELLAQKLRERFPHLIIAGTYSPPFRTLTPEEDAQVVDMINAANPDLVWVGLSTPKQERWMASHIGKLSAPVLLGVGAAFDFHAGVKKQAPLWMQRSGLEWLFRLLSEPSRLWKRYLYNNPRFVWLITLQALGLRKYTLDDA
jgi:N-acetylglucosaminyldiphosphoundecaprenol N-acetyl-beta-D-mannosaminyltransferase